MGQIARLVKKKLYFVVAGYFAFWAGIRLKRWNPKNIVITGSTGKTTAFKLFEAQLGDKAYYSHDANSSFGVPFNVLGLKRKSFKAREWFGLFFGAIGKSFVRPPKQKVYVVECDAERPNEGKFLAKLLKPDVVFWLNSSNTHAMNFDDSVRRGVFKDVREAIAHEYGYFVEQAQELVVTDGNSKLINSQLGRAKAKVLKYSESDELKKYTVDRTGTTFDLSDGKVSVPALLPKPAWLAVLASRQVAEMLGMDFDSSFKRFELPPGRSGMLEGVKDTVLIDSSYNSSAMAVREVLLMFSEFQSDKKWLVISDILEAGKQEEEVHKTVAEEIIKHKKSWQKVILVGRRMSKFVAEDLEKNGIKPMVFSGVEDTYQYIMRNIRGGEAILFKGSQFLEMIVGAMLANPKRDEKLLARRGGVWDRKRLGFTGKTSLGLKENIKSSDGRKREIVILPGWMYEIHKWNALVDELEMAGHKVTLLGVPGLSGEELKEAWALEDYVKWLKGELAGRRDIVLMGHSNGGRISIKYLADNLDGSNVSDLVLIGSAGLVDRRFKKLFKKNIMKMVAKTGKKIVGDNATLKKLMYKAIREHDYERANPVMQETMRNLIDRDLTPELKELSKAGPDRVLLVWGEKDGSTPLFMGQEMKKLLGKKANLEVIKGAMHSPQFTNVNQVFEVVEKFLSEEKK